MKKIAVIGSGFAGLTSSIELASKGYDVAVFEKNDQPGGNNKTWNWSKFSNPKKLPFILSGGLNELNVSEAIDLTGANFVDINSGVEEKKGEKNLSLIDRLVSSLK